MRAMSLLLVSAVLALQGCAGTTPTTQFHTLLAAAPAAAAAAPRVAWELTQVSVPAQVDRPQLVVRTDDDGIVVLEQQRWIAPLADEMRDALVEHLTQRLGPTRPGAQARRVRVDVQRFDSLPGRQVRLVAEWSVAGSPSCRVEAEQAVGPGYAALVAGHRRALARLADAIAVALQDGKHCD